MALLPPATQLHTQPSVPLDLQPQFWAAYPPHSAPTAHVPHSVSTAGASVISHTHPYAFVYLHPTGVSRHLTHIPYLRPRATQPFSSSCSWDDLCDPPARLGHLRPEGCFLLRFPPSWTLARCFLPACLLGTSSGQCNLDMSPPPFPATTLAPTKSMQVLGRGFFPSVFFLVLTLGPQLFLTDLIFFAAALGSQKIGAESTEISQVSIPLRSDFRIC